MRRIWQAGFVLLGLAVPALAQTAAYVYTPLTPPQFITVGATAVSLTVPLGARLAQICTEQAEIRYRDDGTAPTAGNGMPLYATQCFSYSGNLTAIQFIAVATPSSLDVSYYR